MYNKKEMAEKAKEWVSENGLSTLGFGEPVGKLCGHLGIDRMTFYNWTKESNSTFLTAIHAGYEDFSSHVLGECSVGLRTLVQGYEKTEVTHDYMNCQGIAVPVTKKRVTTMAPDLQAIQWVQSNMDPSHWSFKQKIEQDVNGDGVTIVVKSEDEKKKIEDMGNIGI